MVDMVINDYFRRLYDSEHMGELKTLDFWQLKDDTHANERSRCRKRWSFSRHGGGTQVEPGNFNFVHLVRGLAPGQAASPPRQARSDAAELEGRRC